VDIPILKALLPVSAPSEDDCARGIRSCGGKGIATSFGDGTSGGRGPSADPLPERVLSRRSWKRSRTPAQHAARSARAGSETVFQFCAEIKLISGENDRETREALRDAGPTKGERTRRTVWHVAVSECEKAPQIAVPRVSQPFLAEIV
jgi:hypothetical protein